MIQIEIKKAKIGIKHQNCSLGTRKSKRIRMHALAFMNGLVKAEENRVQDSKIKTGMKVKKIYKKFGQHSG